MEGSDETGVMQRIQSSFGNCSSSVQKQSNQQMCINGQMQNLSVEGNNTSSKRPAGIPPSHPHFPPAGPHSPFGVPKMGSQSQQVGTQNFAMGSSHSRSLSQPSFFSFDHLPPLSPSTFRESPQTSGSDRVVNDLPMEGRAAGNSHGCSVPAPFSGGSTVHLNEGLPPRRGHRRSSSDIPLGFSSIMQPPSMAPGRQGNADKDKPAQLMLKREADFIGSGNAGAEGAGERKYEGEVVDDLFSAYMNLDNLDALNSSSVDDKDMDSRASGTRTNESSENEVESSSAGNSHGIHGATSSISTEKREGGKRSAPGDIAPSGRHFRSLSMDSFMGNLNFSEESPRVPPSPGNRSAQHSPSDSLDGNTNNFSLEFGNGEFSPVELKKIMTNEKLAEIAMADPKRAKRILANRQSAARSKERKLRYISELEHKVQTLQTEATTLSAQLTLLQRDSVGLNNQNSELRFRLQAMEQQAQLRDALNEALTTEVQRLKLVTAELRGEAPPSGPSQQQFMANSHMYQMQPSQYMYHLQLQQQQQNNQKQQQPKQQSEETQQNQSAKSQTDAEASKS